MTKKATAKVMFVIDGVVERETSRMLSANLTSRLDFACYVQVVANYVLAFDQAMQQDFDVIVLPRDLIIDDFPKEDFVHMMAGASDVSAALIHTVEHDSVSHVPGKTVRCAKTGGYLVDDLLTAITICMDRGRQRGTCAPAMLRTAPLVPTVQRIPQPKRSRDESLSTVNSLHSVESSDRPPDQIHSHQSKKARCELPSLPIRQESASHAARGWLPSVSPEEQAHWQYCQWWQQWQMLYRTQAYYCPHLAGMSHASTIAASTCEHFHPTHNPSDHSFSHSHHSYILPFSTHRYLSTHQPHAHHPYTHHNRYLSNENRAVYPHEVSTGSYGRLNHASSSGTSENSSSSATTEEEGVSVTSTTSTDHLLTYPSADGVEFASLESVNNDSTTNHTETDFDINELFNVDLWDF